MLVSSCHLPGLMGVSDATVEKYISSKGCFLHLVLWVCTALVKSSLERKIPGYGATGVNWSPEFCCSSLCRVLQGIWWGP